MSSANLEAVRLLISNLSRKDKLILLGELAPATPPATSASATPTGPRVYSPERVAELFDKSKRMVFKLAGEGLLERVTLPGRKRAVGFTAASVERLLAGGVKP